MSSLKLIDNDLWLEPYQSTIVHRFEKTKSKLDDIKKNNTNLSDSVNGHLYYGLHRGESSWVIREWAPNATSI